MLKFPAGKTVVVKAPNDEYLLVSSPRDSKSFMSTNGPMSENEAVECLLLSGVEPAEVYRQIQNAP